MNREQFKNGAKTFGKGCLYAFGTIATVALSIAASSCEAEEKEKYGESFKDVMTALTNSNIPGYYQKEIIEAIVTKELTDRQMESIIAICDTDMAGYYKHETIMKIVE